MLLFIRMSTTVLPSPFRALAPLIRDAPRYGSLALAPFHNCQRHVFRCPSAALLCCHTWLRWCRESIAHTFTVSCALNKLLLLCSFLAGRASMGGMVSARALLPFCSGCRVQPSSPATICAFCCYIPTTISLYVTFDLLHTLQS
jgi:hypothetical protein